MEAQTVYTVLLRTSDSAAAQRWAEMLAGLPARLLFGCEAVSESTEPEIVVTDQMPAADSTVGPQLDRQLPVGWVAIGLAAARPPAPTEVFLPADCSARELQLACRLLAELVRVLRVQRAVAAAQQQLAQEALTDPLTGLPNRRAWQLAVQGKQVGGFRWPLETGEPGAAPERSLLCAAILDLDQFKHVNDAHGYLAGDEVLRTAARAMQTSLRQRDLVARVGGDEFALLLPVHEPASVLPIIERVRKSVPQRLIAAGQHAVTVSAGYCVLDSSADCSLWGRPDELLETLHAALRRAKQDGRDRSQLASTELKS